MKNISIEERAMSLAQYIIDSKDTVGGAVKKWVFQSLRYIQMQTNCKFKKLKRLKYLRHECKTTYY